MSDTQALAGAPKTAEYTPGAFVWHEYVSRDTKGAQKFYSELFGWTIKGMPMTDGHDYPEIYIGEKPFGGFHTLAPDQGPADMPAHWFGYVSVPDVDAAAQKGTAAGGRVLVGPMDIPSVGRFATLMDPQGAVFAVFHSTFGDPDPGAVPGEGEICWDSLGTTDVAAGTAFYEKVVGWSAGDAGEAGGVFKMGDMMEASFSANPEGVPTHWLAHMYVKSRVASCAKAEALGAKILMAQIPTPFGDFAVVQDPYGAVFSIFEGKE